MAARLTTLQVRTPADRAEVEARPAGPVLAVLNPASATLVGQCVGDDGIETIWASDGPSGLDVFRRIHPAMVLASADLGLLSGFDLCRLIRCESVVPVLLIADAVRDGDHLRAMECGADEYLPGPWSVESLRAVIRSHLVGAGSAWNREERPLVAGPFRCYPRRREFYAADRLVEMPRREFEVVEFLMRNAGFPVPRKVLLSEVWGWNFYGDQRTLDVHIRRIRARIEEDPARPRYLKTVRGYGYKFQGR